MKLIHYFGHWSRFGSGYDGECDIKYGKKENYKGLNLLKKNGNKSNATVSKNKLSHNGFDECVSQSQFSKY